jgi:hypothetical protein
MSLSVLGDFGLWGEMKIVLAGRFLGSNGGPRFSAANGFHVAIIHAVERLHYTGLGFY